MGKDVEGSGHGPFEGTIPAVAWRDWGVGVPADIRTEHLPNTNLELRKPIPCDAV
jgi:hypothetical protein